MKQILGLKKNRYIIFENGHVFHRLAKVDTNEKFYWTICDLPIAFEEEWRTFDRFPEWNLPIEICGICGPIM